MAVKTAHEVILGLVKKGYTYKQLSEFYELSISTLHHYANGDVYNEKKDVVILVNSKKPTEKPKWADRIKRGLK